MSGPQKGPLAGVRVLELARILAGPWAGQTLADLGAEVIKVERPGAGDDTRGWGPPFMEDKRRRPAELRPTISPATAASARSRSTSRRRTASASSRSSRRDSDVLIENFKFGGLAKYGLDYKSLSAENPRLVYCSITGFGQDGPYKTRAGYDLLVQGMGGIMDITGDPDGEPTRLGVAFADVFTGVYSALAITAALKEREHTGKGSHIDMALLDTMVGVLANQATYLSRLRHAAGAHGQRARQRRALPDLPDHRRLDADRLRQRRPVRQDDGRCSAIPTWRRTSATRTNAGARGQSRHADPAAVRTDRKALQGRARRTSSRRSACRPDRSTICAEVFADPQVIARDMRIDLPHPAAKGGMIPGVRSPITINGRRAAADRAPPKVGEHTEEILREIGEA